MSEYTMWTCFWSVCAAGFIAITAALTIDGVVSSQLGLTRQATLQKCIALTQKPLECNATRP